MEILKDLRLEHIFTLYIEGKEKTRKLEGVNNGVVNKQ
jgi:hypothetical protein